MHNKRQQMHEAYYKEITNTQWLEIIDKLNIHISELINQKHPDFVKIYGDKEINLEQDDWLKLMEKHPIITQV